MFVYLSQVAVAENAMKTRFWLKFGTMEEHNEEKNTKKHKLISSVFASDFDGWLVRGFWSLGEI